MSHSNWLGETLFAFFDGCNETVTLAKFAYFCPTPAAAGSQRYAEQVKTPK